ncbi:Anaerobic dimethyl sulfoxide reductase chain C [Altererythrobacter epoxidivorans]|uniref:Anaerobic dimethyl sulfoxide reductase chain C n=1 Tax=Altererythrobacter epoxidivorans TaxID=361183 RepID=A0A0M4MSG2_9SPHN|nr:DmsC/YnfH family molybdoenzyme membrane anchor subunit [Altererythrobacter epoxidivorans]ALE16095.1 Anaerobic dimethyl sulfoxide reductase chain C [Altererythrobacter epoxidivorans]
MHPAKSVIFFTTASGAGYGMMVWLAVLATMGLLPQSMPFGIIAFGLGLGLIVAGLLSSTFHLGRPERAWRALSQWRSSWLSREGVSAIITFAPLGLFALMWTFAIGDRSLAVIAGLIGAVMSLVTVFTTSKIYASLKTIPAWHNGWTVAGYLVLGPMNGAVILALLLSLFGAAEAARIVAAISVALLLAGLVVKRGYWSHIHSGKVVSTAGTATGLGHLGKVEMTASPHDTDNYLLREMGFRIARKHAEKLRRTATLLAFIVPLFAIAAALTFTSGAVTTIMFLLAAMACQIGITAERWLFFAEAKHAVTLYYGEQAV